MLGVVVFCLFGMVCFVCFVCRGVWLLVRVFACLCLLRVCVVLFSSVCVLRWFDCLFCLIVFCLFVVVGVV